MEDLLRKDIFKDKDLCKLSPDYAPSEVLMRMEMRRSMVNNTHNHGIAKTPGWQRRTLKKTNSQVINKEIENIRNNFHSYNLKNQIILKHDINFNKFHKIAGETDLFLDDIQDIAEVYLPKIINHDDLVICNSGEFKLNVKPKQDEAVSKTVKLFKGKHACNDETSKEFLKENNNNEIIRIECKYVTPRDEIDDDDAKLEDNNGENNKAVTKHETYLIKTPRVNENKEDLQSLLVMMAFSTKITESDDKLKLSPTRNDDMRIFKDQIEFASHNAPVNDQPETDKITHILNITPLKILISDRQIKILRKYVQKWKAFVNHRKESISRQRQEALDNFFEKLAKRKMDANQPESVQKAKLLARDYNTYQHRYKIQKHIIALQKAKLEEQNRLIEELKYNKIVEASKQSVEEMKEEIRKTYYEIDRQLKPKIKCLTNELKINDIEEPALVLHCLKVPQFLQRMEKRAREREEKHAMIRERRRQLEEERIRVKQQAELAKAEMDKEEKMRRIIELREKRKKERIEAIRKKQHADRIRALIVMADLHYERYLMVKYCIRPFRKLLQKRRDNIEKAKAHYTFQLKKNVFLHWMWYTEDMWYERNYKAEDFHRKKVLRKALDAWKQVGRMLISPLYNNYRKFFDKFQAQMAYIRKKQVAEDYYDFYVTQLVFRHFRRGIEVVKKENEMKYQKAVLYYNGNLLFKVLTCWRTLPALNALKREQDARKARWREKVLQVVPDYAPPED